VLSFALALSASLVWGVADFAAAVRARTLSPIAVAAIAQLFGAVLLGVLLLVVPDPFPGWGIWVPAAIAGVLGAVAHPVFYRALSIGPIGVVAPILAMAAAGPVLWGIFAAGETPTLVQVAGLGLAILGVVLVSRQKHVAEATTSRYAAIPLALLAIVLSSGMFIALDAASEQSGLWGVSAQRTIGLPILLVAAAVLLRGTRPFGRGNLLAVAPIGLADTAALLAFGYAAQFGDLSLVIVLSSLYPVVTILLARFILGEHLALIQRLGAVVAFAGVLAIVLG
jgi:drug/metabolite transporter (DMT)-like permease